MKVALIQAPKYYWPFVNHDDNYMLPQWMVYIGAILEKHGFEIVMLDCLPKKMGWKSLAKKLEEEKPDIVACGENHALYAHEAVKALQLAKSLNPNTICIGGGSHFTNLLPEYLNKYPEIDFIVRKEGELTMLELCQFIRDGRTDYENIQSIAYRDGDQIRATDSRPLIKDLDSLPMPAYHLMPMADYGTSKFLFSPGGMTIHHSRGCVSDCKFCAWWLQFADAKPLDDEGTMKYLPRWRTFSVDRNIEEIKLLYHKYNKKCLVFCDESWNINAKWSNEWAEKIIALNLKGLVWMAFMRIDCLLRDEKQGILEKLVRSGLCHIAIGVERGADDELDDLRKGFYTADVTKEAFHLFKRKYPQVFRQGTFIVGLRDDDRESLQRQVKYAKELQADYPGFHPITPVPGTDMYKEAKANGWIEVDDFTQFDWMTPIISSKYMSRAEIEEEIAAINRQFTSFGWLIKGLFSKSSYKRNMYLWWCLVVFRVTLSSLRNFVNPFKREQYTNLVKPAWYDA